MDVIFELASFLSATDLAVEVELPVPFMFVMNLEQRDCMRLVWNAMSGHLLLRLHYVFTAGLQSLLLRVELVLAILIVYR